MIAAKKFPIYECLRTPTPASLPSAAETVATLLIYAFEEDAPRLLRKSAKRCQLRRRPWPIRLRHKKQNELGNRRAVVA